MLELQKCVELFLDKIKNQNIDDKIYNEFSLQHELGIFLAERLPDYTVNFERNVNHFGIPDGTSKKEIDITIIKGHESYAIELKYPINGQFPMQMVHFIKDIKFIEELVESTKFNKGICLTFVKQNGFHSRKNVNDGIYSYFRETEYKRPIQNEGEPISHVIGDKTYIFDIKGSYNIEWKDLNGGIKYYIVEIPTKS